LIFSLSYSIQSIHQL